MEITVDDLKKIRFFDDYTDKQLEIITSISCIKEIAVKEVLFEQYDKLNEIAVLLEGTLSLGISLAKEKRIHLGTIEEGQLFSWSAIFTPYIATAWVMAVTPAKLIAIDALRLREEIDKDCNFGFKTMSKIAATLSQRLSDTRFQLMNQLML
ncbi:MAG: Crp/Fnr family transcriptional regulator [Bacteroidales bacterium]|nr:Crp/Fnr family transcriptional regulator [Bacteroidales bacterium]MBN2634160.1 Crp/Fnr family transcriptional regulator [Bacteroidales bacterium]